MSIEMTIEDIIYRINLLLLSKNVCSLFINGAPGSGKSDLLNQIKSSLPSVLSKTELLGPYKISSVECLIEGLVANFNDRAMLRENIGKDPPQDLFLFWSRWVNEYLCLSDNTKLIILIDLIEDEIQDLDEWRVIFSGIRNLELITNEFSSKFLIITTGYWDHTKLLNYYNEVDLSPPYTEIDNYLVWDGVTFDQLKIIIHSKFGSSNVNPVHLPLLYEITSGHPGFLSDIIQNLPQDKLTYQDILNASQLAARNGVYAKKMVKAWEELSSEAHKVIENVLLFRTIPYQTEYVHQLKVAGLVKDEQIGENYFIKIKSYFIELILYCHKDELCLNGILDFDEYSKDVMPRFTSNNFQAYKIIIELENWIRNIVVTWLYNSKNREDEHILKGRAYHRSDDTDALQRALDWKYQRKNQAASPLISYLSIRDLSELIQEMEVETGNRDLHQISLLVNRLADLRDSVMHNQIVGDNVMSDLWDISETIYSTSFFTIERED